MLVRWNKTARKWVINFDMIIRDGEYPTGEDIRNGYDGSERAALVLLAYFGLEKRANDFTPEEIAHMSPNDLEALAKDIHEKAPHNP